MLRVPRLRSLGGGWKPLTAGAAPPATDPFFANVRVLLHFDAMGGAGGLGRLITNNGNDPTSWSIPGPTVQQVDNAVPLFVPGANLQNVSAGAVVEPASASTGFALGDNANWTIEMWVRTATPSAAMFIWRFGSMDLMMNNSKFTIFRTNAGGTDIVDVGIAKVSTWQHVALCHAPGILRFWVEGSLATSDPADTLNYNYLNMMKLSESTAQAFIGRMEEFRLTVGTCRYTAPFTPTGPFPNS